MKKIIIFGIVFVFCISFVSAYDLEDSFTTGDDTYYSGIRNTLWRFQTFTTNSAYNIKQVDALIYRTGSPGSCVATIRATSGTDPTGSDLVVSDGVSCDSLTTDKNTGEWVSFTFSSSYSLSGSVKYALILKCPDGDSSNNIGWRVDTGNGYSDGTIGYTTTSGSTWVAQSGADGMFKTYSETASPCVYSGTGNWVIDDNCTIESNYTLETGKILYITAGNTALLASGVTIT